MEKNRKNIYKKLTSGILAASIILGACSCAKKDEAEPKVIIQTVIVTPTPMPTNTPTPTPVPTPTPTPTPTPVPTSTPTPTPTPTPEDETKETNSYGHEVGSYDAKLDSVLDTINNINEKIDSVDLKSIKESTINYAKELIDFIFYGGEINGVTFDELKDESKQKVYAQLQKIDTFIMQFVPDYKEKIGEKYNYVKDFASKTLEEAKEIINSKINIEVNVEKGKSKKKKLTLKK